MTNQTPENVIAEVIEYHADTIGTHYDGCYKHHAVCLAVKLRDMLREPGVPDAPRRAVRELIAEARGFWGSETREYAEGLVGRLADALEAATRVPVHGEPNDDRTPEFEAIEQELFKHQPLLSMQDGSIRGCKCMDRVFVTKTEDWGTHLAEVFTRLSRATVPDAATEELARIKPLFENYSREYPNECNKRVKAEAERDAALAALERVRALETFSITDSYPAWTAVDHDDLLAALDGAPEPDTITIPRPVVPFGPVSKTENEATADYLLEVVKKIDGKYCAVGGSNVTATVRKLLVDAADAVRGLPVEGEKP